MIESLPFYIRHAWAYLFCSPLVENNHKYLFFAGRSTLLIQTQFFCFTHCCSKQILSFVFITGLHLMMNFMFCEYGLISLFNYCKHWCFEAVYCELNFLAVELADLWLYGSCDIVCFDAPSRRMGTRLVYAITYNSCRVEFEITVPTFASLCASYICFITPFFAQKRTSYSSCQFCWGLHSLLFSGQWICYTCDIDLLFCPVCSCHCTSFL